MISFFNGINIYQQQDVDNLEKLHSRARGELLSVSEGRIKTMTVWEKICRIFFKTYRDEADKKLQNTICDLTKKISLTEKSSNEQTKFVEELFLDKLAPLSIKVHRRVLSSSVFQHLNTKIESKSQELAPTFYSAQFWARLGNFKATTGGVGGSYCILPGEVEGVQSPRQGILGIFKPHDEDTLGSQNPKFSQKVLYRLGKTLFYPIAELALRSVSGQAYVAEAANKILERYVLDAVNQYLTMKGEEALPILENLELVPDTKIVDLQLGQREKKIGSFQLWVNEKNETAAGFLGTKRHYGCNSATLKAMQDKIDPKLFDLLVILDVISGNFDRHGDNWLVTKDPQTGNAKGIRLIDGGWSMAPEHPEWWHVLEGLNQHLWKKLPFADEKFTDLGQFVIQKLLEQSETLSSEIKALYDEHLPQKEENKSRVNKMLDRLHVLHKARDSKTKREIAEVRTGSQIRKFLAA